MGRLRNEIFRTHYNIFLVGIFKGKSVCATNKRPMIVDHAVIVGSEKRTAPLRMKGRLPCLKIYALFLNFKSGSDGDGFHHDESEPGLAAFRALGTA